MMTGIECGDRALMGRSQPNFSPELEPLHRTDPNRPT